METLFIKGNARTIGNKQTIKTLRRNGEVPCVMYGHNLNNLGFSIDEKDLKKITHTPKSYIIKMDIEGKEYTCVFHSAQYHPVTDEALHVDFLSVSNERPVVIDIPIVLTGNSEGVKQGGKLKVKMRKMRVSGLLKDLPAELEIDITSLGLGQSVKLASLSFEGLTIEEPKSSVVCSVMATRDSNKK